MRGRKREMRERKREERERWENYEATTAIARKGSNAAAHCFLY
jgi:hypothetical protein